ncbi:MAG TPA: histidinol dehydrogenase [Sphaerochaetaceae bacterium]|nr:histidinol dehydrogenase [Sphaerochaetaceae bacterium]
MERIERIIQPDARNLSRLLARPDIDSGSVKKSVAAILKRIEEAGDAALVSYTREFDCAKSDRIIVPRTEVEQSASLISAELKQAIDRAKGNIERFHRAQKPVDEKVETEPGVYCWRKSVPLQTVGIYIPGGSAPLFSTVLMLAVPARIAGCEQIVLTTPPKEDGSVDPAILYAALTSGVTTVVAAGGAQAIGALAYGTESVPAVDKIFGPGNRYVTEAKQQVAAHRCAIDMPAGPSEVMVVIDETSSPAFAAADMLSQAEHGPDSQSVLVVLADSLEVGNSRIDAVEAELEKQLEQLERKELIEASLAHAKAVVVTDISSAAMVVNSYAPEHLIICLSDFAELVPRVRNAGSVFLGRWSCESVGDYASGTNHTLPTYGWARSFSGVSLDSFYKKITFQRITRKGLEALGPIVQKLARAESLDAHAQAVAIRLQSVGEESR